MDGIKKPQIAAPIELPPIIQIPQTPVFPKREELYISREETAFEQTHEQAFKKGRRLQKFFWISLATILLILMTIV